MIYGQILTRVVCHRRGRGWTGLALGFLGELIFKTPSRRTKREAYKEAMVEAKSYRLERWMQAGRKFPNSRK